MGEEQSARRIFGRVGLSLLLLLNFAIGSIGLTKGPSAAKAAVTPTLLISELFTNPSGSDSPFEWVELLATGAIDFTTTPFSVVFTNNGAAAANGWVQGGTITYGFSITTGTVSAGDVVYVGGSSMAPTRTKLRTIATGTTAGDGFGSAVSGGVLGNGGDNGDAIAVFSLGINSLTSTSVPDDTIFFGTGLGTAVVSGGTAGYELPSNDRYSGGKLQSDDFFAPDPGSGTTLATGTYNPTTGSFTEARTWTVGSLTDGTSAVTLSTADPDPSPSPSPSPSPNPDATITNTYTLAELGLADLQPDIANDRGFLLGGVGSDLWHQPGDAPDEFWMITDRGPNGQIRVNGANRRTFPVPDFDPTILHVKVSGTMVTVLEAIPIQTQSGDPVTGLPNLPDHDEVPYDYTAQTMLDFNQNGIDSEGLVRTADGTFWVAEEYGPSLLKVGADGTVIGRWTPAGIELPDADYPVSDTLPGILGERKGNRGFEGLGLSPDGNTLYAVVQSPLSNPDEDTGEASRLIRTIAFDTVNEVVTGEYVYQFEVGATFDPEHPDQDEMKSSALIVIDPNTLLIQERTDWVSRLYLVDLTGATSILGTQWDNPSTNPSLEALSNPAGSGVPILPKTLRLDLETIPNVPNKIEGVALIDCTRLAIANDNDFDIGTFDQDGNNVGAGLTSTIQIIALTAPITPTCVNERLFIHDIQGASHTSPYAGQLVTGLEGIVVAKRSNGFYMQEADIDIDADPATSEGILVFTSSAPAVNVGDKVNVAGTVVEFRPGGGGGTNNLSITEISNPDRTVTVISSNNPLPSATIIGAGGRVPPTTVIDDDTTGSVEVLAETTFDPANDGLDFYKSLEGMRVQVNNAVAVGPTNDFGELPVLADNGANGAGTRTVRGGIVIQPGDFNPERIILDDAIIGNANMPKVSVGTTLPGAVFGVLDYDFGNFKFLVTTNPVATDTTGAVAKETTPLTVGANQLTVATFNVENLQPNNPQAKFDALAGIIVNNLRSPDIIALEEVQDNNGATNDSIVDATATYNKLIATIAAAGGPTTYQFRQIDPVDDQDGGEPGGNIRVGFLFRTDRGVAFVDRPGGTATAAVGVTGGANGPELTLSPGRIDPTNSAFNSSRKPLAAEFTFNGQPLFLVANHFNSKGGDQPLYGRFQPPTRSSEVQREQQATIVRDFVDDILALDPDANVIVLGDINDFQFSNVLTILEGSGATRLHTLIETLPLNEQYSYVFDGNSQALDHILISPNLFNSAAFAYDIVHVNAEFSPQDSDHDPQLVRLTLAPVNNAPVAIDGNASTGEDTSIEITLAATDPNDDPLTYTIVAPPTHGTLGAPNGNKVVYTPAPDYTGPDSFTFRANDGTVDSNIATVTIAVGTTNDPPQAGNGTATTPAGTATTVTLTATDPEGAPLTYSIVTPPAHGTLGAVVGNRVTYTPATGYSGPDTFTFRASDGVNNSNVATVSITVLAPPPPPTLALTVGTTGAGAVSPGSGQYGAGDTVTLEATPDDGATFIGWTVDGAPAGLANPLTVTMNAAHTVTANFAATPDFSDIAGTPYEGAIVTLTAYGAILGYGDGTFGPNDELSRAQMAALIARAMGWRGEEHGNPFTDRGGIDAELWRSVGTLAFYSVAFGYGNGTFGPNDDVSHIQSISFTTRAMVAKGYWVRAQTDDSSIYPNVPATSSHRLDLVTFVQHAGTLPQFADSDPLSSWDQPATRGWYAAALLQALESRFATTP